MHAHPVKGVSTRSCLRAPGVVLQCTLGLLRYDRDLEPPYARPPDRAEPSKRPRRGQIGQLRAELRACWPALLQKMMRANRIEAAAENLLFYTAAGDGVHVGIEEAPNVDIVACHCGVEDRDCPLSVVRRPHGWDVRTDDGV